MGRNYAGILGPVAFATIVARGLLDGSGLGPTLKLACLCLFGFAAAGYVIGQIGGRIIRESVRAQFDKELATLQAADQAETTG
jgi:uncharacterized membrane protein